MALDTYAGLQTAIANWADRTDLDAFIPDFIHLTEARFNRVLRLRAMEQSQFAVTVGGESNYALPTNFLQMREFRINTEPTVSLRYVSPEIFEAWNLGQGTPKFYTIIANEIRLGPTPAGAYEIEMLYWRRFPALTTAAPTNWMLENAPDVYLYGSLLELEPFIQNDARIAVWGAGYTNAIESIQSADDKDRHSGSALTVQT
jgi:hypothetical protein